jgi:sugar phosphate isomerase/epimerase
VLRIGIDSYSYHRLLGEIRPGEDEPSMRWEPEDVIRHARSLGVDGVSLETCFLDPAAHIDGGPLDVVIAWGHRHGLEYGANRDALRDLLEWLERAARFGCRLVRCVAASPAFRGRPYLGSVEPLAVAAARARELGLRLALENHGDLQAAEVLELVERVDDGLGVCLDTANALRVGDDPVEATTLLGALVQMVHLKDVEPLDRVTDPVAGPCSVPYGDGVVDVRGVLEALSGFNGLVCVELGQLASGTDELQLVEDGVDWLRDYASSNG